MLCQRTYLSWDEYSQAITAQQTLQFQEQVEDMEENPHLVVFFQRMNGLERIRIAQQAKGMGVQPSEGMKFLHSIVALVSKKCRKVEMAAIDRAQAQTQEATSSQHNLQDALQMRQLQAANNAVQMELKMRATTMDLYMMDNENRQERGIREKMKVWTDPLSPSLNKFLLHRCLRAASMMAWNLYETQSLSKSVKQLVQAEAEEDAEVFQQKAEEAMIRFAQSVEEFMVVMNLWHLRSVVSRLDQ